MNADNQENDADKREMKVTDRRMFTPEGELRDEFKEVGETVGERSGGNVGAGEPAAAPPSVVTGAGAGTPAAPPRPAPQPPPGAPPPGEGPRAAAPLELPGGGGPAPGFYDLIGLLAEPASIYLQQAQEGGEDRAQNLELARIHLELLEVLRRKTAGNVTAQESAALEDVLYRLRMGYVQVRG